MKEKTSYLIDKATFNQQITGFHSDTEHNKYYFYQLRSFSETIPEKCDETHKILGS